MYNLSSLLPIKDQLIVLVGNSGSGKSSFCKILCQYVDPKIPIYYHNPNGSEFSLTRSVTVLNEISFENSWFDEHISSNSIVICDDFSLDKSLISGFRTIVNYYCRHKCITLFVIIHSLFKNNIYNEINLSSHLFLLKSESGRQIATRKKCLNAYKTLISSDLVKQLLYINLIDEYCLTLSSNISLQIIKPIEMFTQNNDIFTIHIKNELCPDVEKTEENNDMNSIYEQYGKKNKRKVFYIVSCLEKNNLLKENFVVLSDSYSMHISDVLSIFLNPFKTKILSKKEILFFKKLKQSTKFSPLTQNVIPNILHKYLL
jgi:energy-coupling factor transporter ATP-binding protein EcfA2